MCQCRYRSICTTAKAKQSKAKRSADHLSSVRNAIVAKKDAASQLARSVGLQEQSEELALRWKLDGSAYQSVFFRKWLKEDRPYQASVDGKMVRGVRQPAVCLGCFATGLLAAVDVAKYFGQSE